MICYLTAYSVTYFAKKVNILLKDHHRLLRRLTSLGKIGFISEVKIVAAGNKKSAEAKKALTDEGYTVVDKDLNDGAGGDDIYLGYHNMSGDLIYLDSLSVTSGVKLSKLFVNKQRRSHNERYQEFNYLYLD